MTTARILQLTDLHVFSEPNRCLKGIPTRELLQDVVSFIQQHEAPFDHVVLTGDHTHDELPASYQAVKSILAPFADRLWQVPGNHDDRAVLRHVFSNRIAGENAESVNFEFQIGDWQCLGLDTHLPGEVAGLFDTSQAEWLKARLAASDSASVALFLHHPPVSVGSNWMDPIGLKEQQRLQAIVESDTRIRLICCGHVHHEFETALHNALVVTTPSTGLQFSPEGDTPTFVASPPGYRVIELNAAAFTTHVVRLPETRFIPTDD